jgi:hypothetical protein
MLPKKQGMGLYDCIGQLLFMVKGNMVDCGECGKRLRFFEGYYHPTLGKKSLVCGPCFDKLDESVVQWRDFILSNTFNPEAAQIVKELHRIPLIKTRKTPSQVPLNHLDYHNTDTIIQINGRTA